MKRTCAHCGEATLSAWKLAFSGPYTPARCPRCAGASASPVWLGAIAGLVILLAFAIAVFVQDAFGPFVGIVVVLAGMVAVVALGLLPVRPRPIWPERLLMGPTMVVALFPAMLLFFAGWWAGELQLPRQLPMLLFAWVIAVGCMQLLGAPLVWGLRRIGRLDPVGLAIGGAVIGAGIAAALTGGRSGLRGYTLMAAVGVATAVVFWFVARGRLSATSEAAVREPYVAGSE